MCRAGILPTRYGARIDASDARACEDGEGARMPGGASAAGGLGAAGSAMSSLSWPSRRARSRTSCGGHSESRCATAAAAPLA